MKHRKTWTSWRRWALPLTALALGACDGRSVLGSSDGALIDLGGADIAPLDGNGDGATPDSGATPDGGGLCPTGRGARGGGGEVAVRRSP
mgnify:CR=1 FL=1